MPSRLIVSISTKRRFIDAVLGRRRRCDSFVELCRRFGFTEKTGYKYWNRFREGGYAALEERSRARTTQRFVAPEMELQLLLLRAAERWGARKLVWYLNEAGVPDVPAASTAFEVLKRHGATRPRRSCRRERRSRAFVPQPVSGSNDTWCADHKGKYRLANGVICIPLTITDAWSRFALCCDALGSTSMAEAKPSFERAFREYGLPRTIRTDNGVPFVAPDGALGLTALSVWWIDLGIHHERISPGCPQQNGQEERFHGTLVREVLPDRAASLENQQEHFNDYLPRYNETRAHEAIGMKPPGYIYESSPRPFPSRIPAVEYDQTVETRLADSNGALSWRGTTYFLSKALAHRRIAFNTVDDGVVCVKYRHFELGRIDERHRAFRAT